ncbi:MAG TPA: hypothetical protein VEW93_13250 [Acidimicrobiales bacterium]|nr:hypothetical protein [Acidimicrobiales bacterium]
MSPTGAHLAGLARTARATAGTAAAWAAEAVATLPAGVRVGVPGAPVPAALREDVLVAVGRAGGADAVAWVHGQWRAFAGSVPDGDVRLALARHAEACARAGRPVPPDALADVLPPAAVRGVRAVVARGRAEVAVEAAARRLLAAAGWRPGAVGPAAAARVVGAADQEAAPGPRGVLGLALVDVPVGVGGLALAGPVALAGAALGALARLAPPVPEVEGADDPEVSLLGALAAEAVPVLLGNAAVRTLVLGSPVLLGVGLRSGASAATVRVGRGRAEVVDGLDPDALVVLQGDVEPLVRLATGVLLREALEVVLRP